MPSNKDNLTPPEGMNIQLDSALFDPKKPAKEHA